MSAFMVSHESIDVVLSFALYGAPGDHGLRWYGDTDDGTMALLGRLDSSNVDEVGCMLLAENRASVNYRYSEDELDIVELYRFTHRSYAPTAVEVLKACACVEYQSCEHPGWRASSARFFLDAVRDKATAHLPGYSDAPWDWSERDMSQRRAVRVRRPI